MITPNVPNTNQLKTTTANFTGSKVGQTNTSAHTSISNGASTTFSTATSREHPPIATVNSTDAVTLETQTFSSVVHAIHMPNDIDEDRPQLDDINSHKRDFTGPVFQELRERLFKNIVSWTKKNARGVYEQVSM